MSVAYLKYRDTLPILEVALLNPDGSAHDLTGSTEWWLHISVMPPPARVVRSPPPPDIADALYTVSRAMTTEGVLTGGLVRYAWAVADWDEDELIVGVHLMEVEVLGGASGRLTFPNKGYDLLQIDSDIANG